MYTRSQDTLLAMQTVIDAPITDRFTNEDKEGLEVIVKVLEKQLTK